MRKIAVTALVYLSALGVTTSLIVSCAQADGAAKGILRTLPRYHRLFGRLDADVDGDHRPEILLASGERLPGFQKGSPARLTVLRRRGRRWKSEWHFSDPFGTMPGGNGYGCSNLQPLRVVDLNRDGRMEILFRTVSPGGSDGTNRLYLFGYRKGRFVSLLREPLRHHIAGGVLFQDLRRRRRGMEIMCWTYLWSSKDPDINRHRYYAAFLAWNGRRYAPYRYVETKKWLEGERTIIRALLNRSSVIFRAKPLDWNQIVPDKLVKLPVPRVLQVEVLRPSLLSFSRDGSVLRCIGMGIDDSRAEVLELWDVKTLELKKAVVLNSYQLNGSVVDIPHAFSPDDTLLAEGHVAVVPFHGGGIFKACRDVKIVDLRTGMELHRLQGGRDDVHALAFSPDGKVLASASHRDLILPDKHGEEFLWYCCDVRLWDVKSGRLTQVMRGGDAVWRLKFSANGKTLRSYGQAGTHLWDLKRGVAQPALPHTRPKPCTGVSGYDRATSPDGRLRATVKGIDPSVTYPGNGVCGLEVEDTRNGRTLWRTNGLWVGPGPLAFSPDGRTLVAVTQSAAVRLWDVTNVRQGVMK